MKKLLALFFIVSSLCFGANISDNKNMVKPTQMKEEIEMLKNQVIELSSQVIKSNNKIDELKGELKGIKKKNEGDLDLTYNIDQIYKSSLIYYKQALLDIKWIIGIIGALFIAAMGVFKWDNNKKLKEERIEIEKIREDIKKNNKSMENEIKVDNKDLKNKIEEKTLNLSNDFNKNIQEYEKQAKKRIEEETTKLEEKLYKIIKEHDKEIKKIKKEINKEAISAKFNNEFTIASTKKTSQECLVELKKLEKNVEDLLDDHKYHLYFQMGYHSVELKEIQNAITFYNKAITFNSTYPNAYNNRAEIYLTLKRFDVALADLVTSLKLGLPIFGIDISLKNYDEFKKYLDKLDNKTAFEEDVYTKLLAKLKGGFRIK